MKDFICTIFTIWGSFYLVHYFIEGVKRIYQEEIRVSERSAQNEEIKIPFVTLCPRSFQASTIGFDSEIISNLSLIEIFKGGNVLENATISPK